MTCIIKTEISRNILRMYLCFQRWTTFSYDFRVWEKQFSSQRCVSYNRFRWKRSLCMDMPATIHASSWSVIVPLPTFVFLTLTQFRKFFSSVIPYIIFKCCSKPVRTIWPTCPECPVCREDSLAECHSQIRSADQQCECPVPSPPVDTKEVCL